MIDTKRLATDAAYWDSVAPEGATHYDSTDSGLCAWMMKVDDRAWCFLDDDGWNSVDYSEVAHDMHAYIPRPQAPEAEWVDGLPPVGCEVEVQDPGTGEWNYQGFVTNHKILICTEKFSPGFESTCKFRKVRTTEQRQRDELVELMESERDNYFPKAVTAAEIADAILSRYNLEPKP